MRRAQDMDATLEALLTAERALEVEIERTTLAELLRGVRRLIALRKKLSVLALREEPGANTASASESLAEVFDKLGG